MKSKRRRFTIKTIFFIKFLRKVFRMKLLSTVNFKLNQMPGTKKCALTPLPRALSQNEILTGKAKKKPFPGEGYLSFILCLSKKSIISRTPKSSDEVGHIFSADYRSHYEVMRDSSVATKSGRGFQKGRGW